MNSFGQILSCLLSENNVKKAIFAQRLNITGSQLSLILHGEVLPEIELLNRMTFELEIDSIGSMLLFESYKLDALGSNIVVKI